jgi:hypothetical protein
MASDILGRHFIPSRMENLSDEESNVRSTHKQLYAAKETAAYISLSHRLQLSGLLRSDSSRLFGAVPS